MSILVDIVILLIAGSTVFLAGKRGFISTVVHALGSLIALLAVFCFTGVISELLSMTPLVDLLSPTGVKAVAMVAIFLLVLLLLKACGKALTKFVKKFSFVRKANALLGLLLGFVLALVRILLFCAAINLISAAAQLGQLDFLVVKPEDTVLYRFFDGIQILKLVF